AVESRGCVAVPDRHCSCCMPARMTIGSGAPSLLKRLWSLVPSGGSLPESVWRARHRFLVGLTFFHVVVIALAGTMMGKRWELGPWALFDDASALHTVGEALIVA